MKILITGGGTQEPIDQARVITNVSTGKTASTLVDIFIESGANVTYVHGLTAQLPKGKCELISFSSHASLEKVLQNLLASEQQYTAVIHLAAVSDYTVETIQVGSDEYQSGKLGKLTSGDKIILTLTPTRKIINHLKPQARFSQFLLVAFKLTATTCSQTRHQAIAKLAQDSNIDLIVHNDLTQITQKAHPFTIFQGTHAIAELADATALGHWLVRTAAHFHPTKNTQTLVRE